MGKSGVKRDMYSRIKTVFRVAVPLIVQGLVFQLQSLTDKAFLGNLDTRYVSAAGAAQMPYLATMDSMVAVSTGLVILVSKLYGAGKREQIAVYVRSMACFNTLLCILIFCVWFGNAEAALHFFQVDPAIIDYSISYIRICIVFLLFVGVDSALQAMLHGMGDTKPIMYAGVIKVMLNIGISWILIFGRMGFPAMGVLGAAIGTLTANLAAFVVTFCYCVIYGRGRYGLLCRSGGQDACAHAAGGQALSAVADLGRSLSGPWVRLSLYLQTIRLGIPVGLEYLLWNFSNLLLIRFVNGFSYQDMAIYTLTFGFQCVIYVVFEGTSKATLSLMGQALGAGRRNEANRYFRTTIAVNFVIVGLAAAGFFLFPRMLLGIFSGDAGLIERGILYLEWMGVIMIPQSLNIICGNAIRANGNTTWMLASQVLGSLLVVSVSWFLVERLGMDMRAIYITLFLDETVRGGINLVYYVVRYGGEGKKR